MVVRKPRAAIYERVLEHNRYSAVIPTRSSRDIAPPFGGFGISFRCSSCCHSVLPCPAELGAVGPDTVHDDSQFSRNSDDGAPQPAPL